MIILTTPDRCEAMGEAMGRRRRRGVASAHEYRSTASDTRVAGRAVEAEVRAVEGIERARDEAKREAKLEVERLVAKRVTVAIEATVAECEVSFVLRSCCHPRTHTYPAPSITHPHTHHTPPPHSPPIPHHSPPIQVQRWMRFACALSIAVLAWCCSWRGDRCCVPRVGV